jgi:hypothetical protein
MGEVISYKHEMNLLDEASVVQFHGRLKPHHVCNEALVYDNWL